MRIYLDHNATTSMHPAVLEALVEQGRTVFGNPSSVHHEGSMARKALEEARESVARLLDAEPKEIVWTSGGTESNNAAILGAILPQGECCHIVTTSIEHPSVLGPVRELESRGHAVTFVPPDSSGVVPSERVLEAIRPETRLVSVMLANNETGALQPVADLAETCRERSIHLHCDAVQAVGKIPVSVKHLGVDSLAISAHKFHGSKGSGALFVRDGVVLHPLILGGSQERRRRAGTEAVPLVVALGVAAELALQESEQNRRVETLRNEMERRLLDALPEIAICGRDAPRLPNTSNLQLTGCDSESMVIALDLEGVSVSAGSACHSGRTESSHVLLAMGLSENEARSCIRVSLGKGTTATETDRLVDLLGSLVPSNRQRGALLV